MNLTKIDLLGFVVAVVFCLLALPNMGFLCFCQFHSRSLYPLLYFVNLSPLTYQAHYSKSNSFIFDNDYDFEADNVHNCCHVASPNQYSDSEVSIKGSALINGFDYLHYSNILASYFFIGFCYHY